MESNDDKHKTKYLKDYMLKYYNPDNYISFSEISPNKNIKRTDYDFSKNDLLFTLENLLSPEECDYLIQTVENQGFQDISNEYPTMYRNCTRKILFSDDLSRILYDRIFKYFEWEDIQYISPFGFEKNNRWLMDYVNPCFRFTKYKDGDFFLKHYDGGHVENNNVRSVLTLMIYLNDDFTGGETIFYNKENLPDIVINPKKSNAMIFNHDILHEGLIIKNGYKYIVRTDIMFKRYNSKISKIDSEEYKLSEKMFYKSVELQKTSNPEESTFNYLEAQKILLKYPSFYVKKLQKSYQNINNPYFKVLNNTAFLEIIFNYLIPKKVELIITKEKFIREENDKYYYDIWKDYDKIYENEYKYLLRKPNINIEKKDFKNIFMYRLISRRFNQYLSGNNFWNKIIKIDLPNLICIPDLTKLPNDCHLFEYFKHKSYLNKYNLKNHIDIGCSFIRALYNQPIIDNLSILNCNRNPYEGKCRSIIYYRQGHLWNSHSGFETTIGEYEYFMSTSSMDAVIEDIFTKDSLYNSKKIVDTIIFFTKIVSEINISLPYFLFDPSYKKNLEIKHMTIPISDYNHYEILDIINEIEFNLNESYFQSLKLKDKEIKKINIKLFNCDDIIIPNLFEVFPKTYKSYELYCKSDIMNLLRNSICRERIFFNSMNFDSGIVIVFDSFISTCVYFDNNKLWKYSTSLTFDEIDFTNTKSVFNGNFNNLIEIIKNESYISEFINILCICSKDKNELYENFLNSSIKVLRPRIRFKEYESIYDIIKL